MTKTVTFYFQKKRRRILHIWYMEWLVYLSSEKDRRSEPEQRRKHSRVVAAAVAAYVHLFTKPMYAAECP